MKQLRIYIYSVLLIFLLTPLTSFGQKTEQKDSSNNKLIAAAREIITAAGNCALISLGEKGLPMVRIMDPFPPDADFTVWFGTNPKSRKVSQIKKNPNVTLYYLDSNSSGYVVIHGKAQLMNDQKEKDKRWKTEWESFYPDKKEGYLLIKVLPEWMEVLSISRGIIGDPVTWQPPIVKFDPEKKER